MKKPYTENLPSRLEAWDAEEANNGWAVSVDDLRKWAEAVLVEAEINPGEAVKYIEELVKHLK